MTLTVDDDFARFVAARWGELEPVAYLVTLDEASARRLTAGALADLLDTWEDAVDHGSPTRAARAAVLGGGPQGRPRPSRCGTTGARTSTPDRGGPPSRPGTRRRSLPC